MSVGRSSLLLAPLAILARGVAFFVPVVLAAWFGVSSEMDAFFYSLNIPTFFLVLGAGAIATVVVPTLAEVAEREPADRGRFVGAAALYSATGSVIVGIAIGVALPHVMGLTSFDPTTTAQAVGFYWALLPSLTLNAVNAVVKAAGEVHGRFRTAGLSPIIRTVLLLGAARLFRDVGPACLPWALALGLAGETVWLTVVLRRAGVRIVPSFTVPPSLLRTGRAFLPVLVGETLVALNVVVDKQFAASLPAGSVSMLEYADRARLIPQTLLESSLMVVAFNAWARARARDDDRGRHEAVARAIWWVFMLAPPALGGMIVGRLALVRALFEHGAFSPESSAPTAAALGAFLPGVFASLLGALVVKAHVVAARYRLVLALGILSFGMNATSDAIFVGPFGLVGLAWSTTVTNLAVVAVAGRALLPEVRGRLAPGPLREALVVVAGSAALTLLATQLLPAPESVTTPTLWLLAIPYVALLAWAGWRVRHESETATPLSGAP